MLPTLVRCGPGSRILIHPQVCPPWFRFQIGWRQYRATHFSKLVNSRCNFVADTLPSLPDDPDIVSFLPWRAGLDRLLNQCSNEERQLVEGSCGRKQAKHRWTEGHHFPCPVDFLRRDLPDPVCICRRFARRQIPALSMPKRNMWMHDFGTVLDELLLFYARRKVRLG